MNELNKNMKLMKKDKNILSNYMKAKHVSRELIYQV
jgi:hypothetical protein